MKESNLKKWKIITICIMMVICSLPLTIYGAPEDETDDYDVVASAKAMPSGKYGGSLTIRLNVKNNSTDPVYNVKASAVVDESLVSVFEVVTLTHKEHDIASRLESAGTSVNNNDDNETESFTFQIRKDVKTGYYPITFNIRYKTAEENSAYTKTTEVVYVKITGKTGGTDDPDKNVDFIMGEEQDTPFGTYPGVMDFSINLQNKGINTAYEVEANMVLSEDPAVFPFEISVANYERNIGKMDSMSNVLLSYSMALREDVKTGYYPIKFNIIYKNDKDGDLLTSEQVFYVRTKGKEEEKETDPVKEIDVNSVEKPRLIINEFSTDPAVIKSGDEFTVTLVMENTSKSITATNILFTLEAEQVDGNDAFTPLSGSTSIVVDSLSPGQTTKIVMPMIAKAGIAPKSYALKVKQKYDIAKLKSIEDTVSVAIPVKQVAKLSIATVEIMPEDIMVGSESNIMFGINNTGKISLYNVNVSFQADSIMETEKYIGNIEPGQTGNVDVMIKGLAPTMDDGKIKVLISYEDDAGVVSTMEKEFKLMVMEDMMIEGEGEGEIPVDFGEFEEKPSFFSSYKVPLIIVGVVLAVIGLIITLSIAKKKRIKKEEEGMADEIS